MKKSKVVNTLKTFTATDMNNFYRFLQSPYFNRRKDVLQLFVWLKKQLNAKKADFDSACIYQKIYAAPYDDQKFRLLKSYLNQLLEKFLVVESLEKDKLKHQLYLAKGYRTKGLTTAYEKVLKKAQQKLEQTPFKNADYFEHYFQILWEQHQSLAADKPIDGHLLQQISDKVDVAYLSLKLKHYCLLATHQNVYGSDFKTGYLQQILSYIQQGDLLEIPSIAIYYYGYLVLTQSEDSTYFKQFKKRLLEKGNLLHPQETRLLFLLGINHTIQKSNNGQKQYLDDLKDLYEEGLKHKYLFENGKLSRFSYLNIISTGISTKDYAWVEHIIYTYKDALEEKYRESSFNFNLARLEYYRKNHSKALYLLHQSQPQNVLLNLASKTLLTKIYYELDELEALESHLGAVKNFVRRKKIMGYHRTKYIDFIQYVQRLLKVNPFDKAAKQRLRKRLNQEADLMEKDWLLEQVNLME